MQNSVWFWIYFILNSKTTIYTFFITFLDVSTESKVWFKPNQGLLAHMKSSEVVGFRHSLIQELRKYYWRSSFSSLLADIFFCVSFIL